MKITLIFRSALDPKGGPNEQVFVEAHDEAGRSIDVGQWAADGEHETLTIDCDRWRGPYVAPCPIAAGDTVRLVDRSNHADGTRVVQSVHLLAGRHSKYLAKLVPNDPLHPHEWIAVDQIEKVPA